MSNRILCVGCALAGLLLGFAYPAAAQPGPSPAGQAYKEELVSESLRFQARVDEVAHALGEDARFKNLTHEQRAQTVEFVAGNLLFVLFHELGHALVSEMGLPVLGKEEDAVDAYAVLAMLMTGNKVSAIKRLAEVRAV
jgi:Putative metallopeptidase